MEHINDCANLVDSAWNRWGSAQVEYMSGTGPMRHKRTGEILPESLIQADVEYHEFKVGWREPFWCIWDGEKLYLTKYPTGYNPQEPNLAPPGG